MISSYNELKLEILEEFMSLEEITAGDMAKALGRTYPSVAMAMLRYHRMGLLSRYTTNRKNEKVYALTDRGLERLDWLMEQDFKDSDDDDVRARDEDEKDESETEQDDDGLNDDESMIDLIEEIRELNKKLRGI